jgi:hypothetical protein
MLKIFGAIAGATMLTAGFTAAHADDLRLTDRELDTVTAGLAVSIAEAGGLAFGENLAVSIQETGTLAIDFDGNGNGNGHGNWSGYGGYGECGGCTGGGGGNGGFSFAAGVSSSVSVAD